MKKVIDWFLKIKAFFHEKYNKYTILSYITVALFVNLIIEMLGRGSFLKGIFHMVQSPYVFICNSLIILMTLSITLLTRRRVFGMTLISIIWIIFGIANCVLLSFRVTPFTAVDMMQVENAVAIMNKYLNLVSYILIVVLAIVAVFALIFIWLKVPKVKHKLNYFKSVGGIIAILAIGAAGINLGIASNVLAVNFGNLADAYLDYGFAYCFTNSLVNTGVHKPSDYSEETIEGITESIDETTDDNVDTPNIIMLQLESFFDVKNQTNLTFSEDPVPTFTMLKENYPHGYLSVPIVGAGTVNTEFEVLTGMNLDDFGPGEYPFKTIITETTCESFAYNLKNYGYTSSVIHNNTATFYGRNVVYSNLGFDLMDTIEFMHIDDFTPIGWAKDYFLTDEIMQTLRSTKDQDFIYTISVQGHGSYPASGEYDTTISVEGAESESFKNAMEYYCTEINEMDTFINELIEQLSNYNEDVILVLYGDHLPSLGISADNLINEDIYQTEYIIWSNFDTDYESEDIEAYQLQSKILEKLGISDGVINAYTQKNKNSEEYLNGLQNLEYDILYGDKIVWNGENPYTATDLTFGLYPIAITSVKHVDYSEYLELTKENKDSQEEVSDDSMDEEESIDNETQPDPSDIEGDVVFVYGTNFTSYSKVYINGEKQKTTYIDDNVLKINYTLNDGDTIVVWQQNSDSHKLQCTDEYIFNDAEAKTETESE